MNTATQITSNDYAIRIKPLNGVVRAYHKDILIAESEHAKVMYETRLSPTIYFPKEDVKAHIVGTSDLNTFCPFKGTASYHTLRIGDEEFENGCWFYPNALPEASEVDEYLGFSPAVATRFDLGGNAYDDGYSTNISGPIVDWILREAWTIQCPNSLTKAIAEKLLAEGIYISRLSILIWSLHPMIAGKNYIWTKETGEVDVRTPSYDIHTNPAFVNSPLRHVSNGLGGVRQILTADTFEFDFPILSDLKAEGSTDYVAMPLPFSNGQINVMTLAGDHPKGFTTANLGLIFEISSVISRYFEVFTQRENSQTLLETYLGERTGARVLGGEIRRGDGEVIEAAILFCDLRNSTALEERLGRDKYLDLLNTFFEQVSDVSRENAGEVLKFIGDAVLAIFPGGKNGQNARKQVKKSALEILNRLEQIRDESEHQDLDCAIGLDYGEVTYGNVGSRERLDFTVIGNAANVAARLADLCKRVDQRIVMTNNVAQGDANTISLGCFELRNVSGEVECFGISVKPEQ